ncbi:transcription elongation factor SPT4 [Uranotaenia lowii]|uniref:transcription elongation factor SPT4 n=1 Tax=Uranotaenia lowii TaxID=190385 RepID=UPI0024792367|nr:transcription elongation factor SPT4 [Uranotaenia lowii]
MILSNVNKEISSGTTDSFRSFSKNLTLFTENSAQFIDNPVANMSFDSVPKDLRGLRACLVCSLVKTFDQFEIEGCENCEDFLRLKGNKDQVYDCTSNNFDGLIAVMQPDDSWVCKWQRINRFNKGVYAISVSGRLPNSVIREMKNHNIPYRSRDTSTR